MHLRIYATLDPLRVECPACGLLILFGLGGRKGTRSPHRKYWDRLASVLICPGCEAKWRLGMVLSPAPRGGVRQPPADQIPSAAQLIELRRDASYVDRQRWGDPMNQFEEEGCTCYPQPWRAGCPVHDGMIKAPVKAKVED